MFVDVPEPVLKDRRLTGTEVRVYCLLSHLSIVTKNEFHEQIVSDMVSRLKEPQHKIWRAMQNLARYGYLEQTSSYNHYRLLKEDQIDGKQHAAARKFDALEYTIPWPELEPAWNKWIAYYQNKYDRVDLLQAEALVNHITNLLDQRIDIQEAINYSIAGGYRQIYNPRNRHYDQRYQNNNGQHSQRKETPFERQKRIIREKRHKRNESID